MELISRHFQAATFSAWRNLRKIDCTSITEFSLSPGKRAAGKRKLKLLLQKLTARSPLISSIVGFDKYVHDFDKSIIISVANFSHLRAMEFAHIDFSPQLFQLFFTTLKNPNLLTDLHLVRTIDIEEWDEMERMDIEECMMHVFRHIPLKLEAFSYETNGGCRGEFLYYVDATNLKELSLQGSQLDGECVTEFLSRCTELLYLNINDLRLVDEDWDLQDCGKIVLHAIASNCSKLEMLEMKDTWFEDLEDPHSVFKNFSRLENFQRFILSSNTTRSMYFPCEVFTAVTTYCRNLTYLEISTELNAENLDFFSPLSRIENLEGLDLCTPSMDGPTVRAFVRSLQDLKKLYMLCFNAKFVNNDNALDSLCTLEKLQKLTVFKGVQNRTLRAWGRGGLLDRLKVLEVVSCKKVSDLGMRYMAKYGSENLEALRLPESAITVEGAMVILIGFEALRELDVRHCSSIDPDDLEGVEELFDGVKIYKGDEENDE